MSEYQYYEFLAIDRPLSQATQSDLRTLSSRARITATSFTNNYQWGDFKGDPDVLMESWFDLHVYLANWGTRQLMIRVPHGVIDEGILAKCVRKSGCVKVRTTAHHVILDIVRQEIDLEWEDDGSDWMSDLAPVRGELLAGDPRLLYLVWLISVEEDELGEDTPEPMPGIGPLPDVLETCAAFFGLDPDLVQAAAERNADLTRTTVTPEAARAVITGLTDREKTEMLSRMFEGDPLAPHELRTTVRKRLPESRDIPKVAPRTVGEIRARAVEIAEAREREVERKAALERERKAREAEAERRNRLNAIEQRGEGAWRAVEAEIERSNASGYGKATELLQDLKMIAEERGTVPEFSRRIGEIRERHARKGRFLARIEAVA